MKGDSIKYKVGQLVKVRSNLKVGQKFEGTEVTEEMLGLMGKEYIIKSLFWDSEAGVIYRLGNLKGKYDLKFRSGMFEDTLEGEINPIKIGTDGRCMCHQGMKCPLGRVGFTERCTEEELKDEGITFQYHGGLIHTTIENVESKSCPLAGPEGCVRWAWQVHDILLTSLDVGLCVDENNNARTIIKTDTQCPCPDLQKAPESKFEKAWECYIKPSGILTGDKEIEDLKRMFIRSLKEAGFTE